MIYVLALLSAAAYGAADFVGGYASRRAAMFAVVTISQLAGLVSLLLVLPLIGAASPVRSDVLWGGAAGVAGGFGVALLYRALAVGTMGVVAPTTSVCAVAIPVLAGFVLGVRLSAMVSSGIALAFVAIVLLGQESAHPDHPATRPTGPRLPAGVWHALASGVGIGLFFLLLARTRPDAGLWPLVAARVAGIPCLAIIVVASRSTFRMPPRLLWLVVAGGALDMLANVLYLLASRYGDLAVAVTLSSLYPASTVVLAQVVLKERLSRLQQIGIVAALVSVWLIVAGGAAAQAVSIRNVAWMRAVGNCSRATISWEGDERRRVPAACSASAERRAATRWSNTSTSG
jgi:drug/metabolite transporter (DMT)-like permease